MSMSLCISAFAVSDEESYSEKEVTSENGNGFLKASHKPVAPTGLPYQAVVAGLSEGAGTDSKYYFKASGSDIKISGTFKATEGLRNKVRFASVSLYVFETDELVGTFNTGRFSGQKSFSYVFNNLKSNVSYYVIITNETPNNYLMNRWISGTVNLE